MRCGRRALKSNPGNAEPDIKMRSARVDYPAFCCGMIYLFRIRLIAAEIKEENRHAPNQDARRLQSSEEVAGWIR